MGSKTQTSTTQQSTTPYALGNLQSIYNTVANAASTPYQAYTGELTAPVNSQQTAGINNINSNASYASPYIQSAAGLVQGASSPLTQQQIQNYQNPYTQSVVNATQAQFNQSNAEQQNSLKGNAASAGALGGDRQAVAQSQLAGQQQLAQAPVIANLYSQGYNNAVNTAAQQYQQNPLAQAGALANFGIQGQNAALSGANAQINAGSLQQQTQQAQDQAAYQQFQNQAGYPFQTAAFLQQYGLPTSLAQGSSSSGTQTSPGPNPWTQALGLGTAALTAYSDARVKENVEEVGKTFDGQKIYRFNYRGSPLTQIGLIAQDVEKKHPDAVGEDRGIKTVDYKGATDDAADKGRYAFGGYVNTSMPYTSGSSYVPTGNASNAQLQTPTLQYAKPASSSTGSDLGKTIGTAGKAFSNPLSYGASIPGAEGPTSVGGAPLNGVSPFGGVGYQNSTGNFNGITDAAQDAMQDAGLLSRGGFVSAVHHIRESIRRSRGGAVTSPFAGYADGGGIDLAERFAPVQEAIANGDFDPQGINSTTFAAPARDTSPMVAAANDATIPLPVARPAAADAASAPVTLPAAIANPDSTPAPEPTSALAYDSGDQPQPAPTPSASPVANPADSRFGSFNPFGLSDKARESIIAAGLGMAASRSPFAMSAIGEGGLKGLGTYSAATAAEQQAADKAATRQQNQQRIDQEAKRIANQASQFAKTQSLAERREKFAEDKTPSGYRQKDDGSYEPIPGGPADPEIIRKAAEAKRSNAALVDDDTADFLAERVLAGDTRALVGFGRGAQGPENLAKVQALVAAKARERGMDASDILNQVAVQSGNTAAQRTFGTQTARMAVNATEAQGAIELGRAASSAVPRTNWVPVNKAIQAYQSGTSDPALAKFGAANLAIINTYARAISPTGVPTVNDKQHAEHLLSTATGPDAYNAVLDQMNEEIKIAHAAPQKAKQEIEDIRKGKKSTPDKAASPSSAPAIPAPPAGLPAGSAYSPSRNQWKAPDGTIYNADGTKP
ncbi:tail fiber domain-containing protein [Bradyrhizobium genosp. L]|uniref:tail fiber domain-containing protein n=1 Tax=Bradyrhizobium genosp. L TaxID=83637 RepID=UPI0018A2D689|nr:tail fiber domain-containing protein [Bradyrhizobium genosp. L]QPF87038.1 tail fiber domain-containing protein [Bradyrhizobium genosp. L]